MKSGGDAELPPNGLEGHAAKIHVSEQNHAIAPIAEPF
jgi:hypothetical protein